MEQLIQQITNIAEIIIVVWALILGPTTIPKLLKPLFKGVKQYISSHLKILPKRGIRVQRYEEVIISLRNIFSLLPLIITWLGLFDAVGSYQKYLQSKPLGSSQSFLTLWQEGFGGISHFTFSQIALIDVVILVLYLILTLLSQAVERQRWLAEEKQYKEEEKQRIYDLIKKVKDAPQEVSLDSIATSQIQPKDNSLENVHAEQLTKEMFKEVLVDSNKLILEAYLTSEKRFEELYQQMKDLFNIQIQMTKNLNDTLVALFYTLEKASQTSMKSSSESHLTGKDLVTDTGKAIEGVSEQFGTFDEKELAETPQ